MPSHGPTIQEPDLERARADRARFLRIVTHDLRQPIAAARTLAAVLAGGHAGPLPPAQADLVARLNQRLEFLQALVDDLIDLATATCGPESGAAPPRTPLSLAMSEACGRAEPAARAAGTALECEAGAHLPLVAVDEADLALLLDHLVINAVKYSPGGRVQVRADETGDSARIVVSDSGIGIPDEDRPRVFEPFFRARNAKGLDPQGTGLGLAIVKAVTDRRGLAIELERNDAGGTTVTVDLPLPPA